MKSLTVTTATPVIGSIMRGKMIRLSAWLSEFL